MLSIQEILAKTEQQRKAIEDWLDSKAYYDMRESPTIYDGLKRSIQREIAETIRATPLKEFLLKSGTTGVAGAAYLVPTVLSAKIMSQALTEDLVPLISVDIVEPRGDTVNVNIASYLTAKSVASGGEFPSETLTTTQATCTLTKLAIPLQVSSELIEDNEYGIIEWQAKEAGRALGWGGTDMALAIMKATPDGVGSSTAEGAGADTTTPTDIGNAIAIVGSSQAKPDTMVVTPEAWGDAITITAGHAVPHPPQQQGYDAWYSGLNVAFSANASLYAAISSGRMTDCVTLVFAKPYALLTARKSWGKIENYSDPIKDLAGAVVTGRQDSVTIYKSAICVVTET